MAVLTFNTMKEYQQWLDKQSYNVKQKAEAFRQKFGDLVPVIVEVCTDTSMYSMGCEHTVHIFINPLKAKEVIENIVVMEGGQ